MSIYSEDIFELYNLFKDYQFESPSLEIEFDNDNNRYECQFATWLLSNYAIEIFKNLHLQKGEYTRYDSSAYIKLRDGTILYEFVAKYSSIFISDEHDVDIISYMEIEL